MQWLKNLINPPLTGTCPNCKHYQPSNYFQVQDRCAVKTSLQFPDSMTSWTPNKKTWQQIPCHIANPKGRCRKYKEKSCPN